MYSTDEFGIAVEIYLALVYIWVILQNLGYRKTTNFFDFFFYYYTLIMMLMERKICFPISNNNGSFLIVHSSGVSLKFINSAININN